MKKGLILSVLLASVPVLGFSLTIFMVRNEAGWIEAVNGVKNGGNDQEYTITVTGAVSVPSSGADNTFGAVTGVKITIEGNGTLSPSNTGSLLVIGKDQTVIARDVTLRGRSDNNSYSCVWINGGTLRMEGKAKVTGNTKTDGPGGGVFIDEDGTFTMQDTVSVSGNTVNGDGGGVCLREGTFTMLGGSVSDNTADAPDPDGGGIYVDGGTFTMLGGSVSGNTAGWGGGVFVKDGTFTMKGGSISENKATSSSHNGGGGGVYVISGFTMEGGAISGNIVEKYGGGIYVQSGTFTMKGGAISGNKTSEDGGGVLVSFNGTFNMQDGAVSGNTADNGGGGVLVRGGTFTMLGGAQVSGNIGHWGGGVLISDGTFAMQDSAQLSGNTGNWGGGGVYIHSGTFTLRDSATVSGNTATFYGGGVFIAYKGTFDKTGGTVSGDDADQEHKNTVKSMMGHAVYGERDEGWRNTGAGPTISPSSDDFWLSEGNLVMFPSEFMDTWKRPNGNNTLTFSSNAVKSSSRDFVWVLQSVSGDKYTLKRSDAAATMTLTIKRTKISGFLFNSDNSEILEISGGSGEDNWNGTWLELD